MIWIYGEQWTTFHSVNNGQYQSPICPCFILYFSFKYWNCLFFFVLRSIERLKCETVDGNLLNRIGGLLLFLCRHRFALPSKSNCHIEFANQVLDEFTKLQNDLEWSSFLFCHCPQIYFFPFYEYWLFSIQVSNSWIEKNERKKNWKWECLWSKINCI